VAATCLLVVLALPEKAGATSTPGPVPGTAQTFSYGTGLSAYPYIVYTPTSYKPDRPLIVMLHGCTTTAEEQMEANLYNPLADQKDFVVAYPDNDEVERLQPGPTQDCWQFPDPQDWLRGQDDLAAIAGITRTIMRRWHIDPQRVYLIGMSAGAFIVSDMAAAYPDIYAAVGQNAGGAYADGTCLVGNDLVTLPVQVSAQLASDEMGPRARIVPRLVIGGDADLGVSPPCADKSLQQSLRTDNLVISKTQGGPISLSPATVVHEPAQSAGGHTYIVSSYVDQYGCVIDQRYLVHGMGHFWSGGSSNPKLADFTDPKGPSAAVASWNFFSMFTLLNTADPCDGRPHIPT
jgi:poly(hydroxyalkanoate) depolymerase family esterase